MALIKCPECKQSASDLASACPKCGYPLSPDTSAASIGESVEGPKIIATRKGGLLATKGTLEVVDGNLRVRKRKGFKVIAPASSIESIVVRGIGDRVAEVRFSGARWKLVSRKENLREFFEQVAPTQIEPRSGFAVTGVFIQAAVVWLVALIASWNLPQIFPFALFVMAVLTICLLTNKPPKLRTLFAPHKSAASLLGVSVLFGTFMGFSADNLETAANEQKQVAQAEADRQRAQAARVAKEKKTQKRIARQNEVRQLQQLLTANAAAEAAKVRAASEAIDAAAETSDWKNLWQLTDNLKATLALYTEIGEMPVDVTAAVSEANSAVLRSEAIQVARKAADLAGRRIAEGESLVANGDYWDGGLKYREAIEQLEKIARPQRKYVDHYQDRLAKVKKLTRKNKHRAEKQLKEVSEAAAMNLVCGKEPPNRSDLDGRYGRYIAAAAYLRRVAHDPSSIEFIGCTDAVLTKKCWKTKCSYRAKNAFGALIVDTSTFYIGANGGVEMR